MIRSLLVLLAFAASAPAGWLTVKNDTDRAVVIETVTDCVLAKRSKAVRLLPGEVYREFRLVPGERKVQLYDGSHPNQPLGQPLGTGTLSWKLADQTLHVEPKASELTLADPAAKPAKSSDAAKSEVVARRP